MKKPKNQGQIVVFQGLLLPQTDRQEFVEFMASKTMGKFKFSYLDEYVTLPTKEKRKDRFNQWQVKKVEGTGGRHDVMCVLDPDHIERYSTLRFSHGELMGRWWEDVIDNDREIIPVTTLKKYPRGW